MIILELQVEPPYLSLEPATSPQLAMALRHHRGVHNKLTATLNALARPRSQSRRFPQSHLSPARPRAHTTWSRRARVAAGGPVQIGDTCRRDIARSQLRSLLSAWDVNTCRYQGCRV